MEPCATCGTYVLGETACPHCGSRARVTRSAAALVLGLALGAATGACTEEMYGITLTPDMIEETDTSSTGDTGETEDTAPPV